MMKGSFHLLKIRTQNFLVIICSIKLKKIKGSTGLHTQIKIHQLQDITSQTSERIAVRVTPPLSILNETDSGR